MGLLDDLDNLQAAPKIDPPKDWRPGLEFDGTSGVATLPAVGDQEKPDFEQFLIDAGFDPKLYEIEGTPRTSRWQVARPFPLEPMWLTSYRFKFRKLNPEVDLPLLYANYKRKATTRPLRATEPKAVVVLWSDLQLGKADHRGGLDEALERVGQLNKKLVELVKREKPERIIFCDVGDTIENFTNSADMVQLQSNTLSIMQQVDLATTLAWDTLKQLRGLVADVTYLSVGSNHCQWRVNKQRVGNLTDDWGVHIGRTLARLSKETGLGIKFVEPHQHDESLAHDVFGDEFHILGLWHGHQAGRPDGIPEWWRKQAFGRQPVAGATIGVSGHFHHLVVKELGSTSRGTSRFWVQAATMDNGSNWYRLNSGEDSQPGLVTFVLEKNVDFTGTVYKL